MERVDPQTIQEERRSEDRDRRTRFASSTGRLTVLTRVLETLTATIELDEVVRRVVTITLEEFGADHAWLFRGIDPAVDHAVVALEVSREGVRPFFALGRKVPLEHSRHIVRKGLSVDHPVVSDATELDPRVVHAGIRTQLAQIIRPVGEEVWAFGLYSRSDRHWSRDEITLFGEIGRYATVALSNALLHRRAVAEAAKLSAILDQIPEAAALYDASGAIERLNDAARGELSVCFEVGEQRQTEFRDAEGNAIGSARLPAHRALRGEQVRQELTVLSEGVEERHVQFRAAAVRDEHGSIIGSVVLARDISEERAAASRELRRRRRAECLAGLGIDLLESIHKVSDLGTAASIVHDSLEANIQIFLHDELEHSLTLVGAAIDSAAGREWIAHLQNHPLQPGDGLAGTVFEIGRPLFFSGVKGSSLVDFGRDDHEKEMIGRLGEETLFAAPIEAYSHRLGVIVGSRERGKPLFDAEELEFIEAVAERLGAAAHIHRLTRFSQEQQRASEELARREVDARARFEAVLETAPVGIAVVSPDELRLEMANPRWVEYAAMAGKIAPGSRPLGMRIDDVLPGLEKLIREVAERGETRFDEAIPVRIDSSMMYFNRIISPVRGRLSQATQSVTLLVQDVTEQVRATREIEALAQLMEERSARLDSIIGSMTDGLWVYDASGDLVDVNQAAVAMFGLASRSEAVARGSLDDFQLRYPDGRRVQPADLPHARALRGEVVPDFLAIGRHLVTGRDFDISVAAAPIEINGIVGAVLVIRDITAVQELDRKKDEFLSVASHELRTPLTTIKGYTQLLVQSVDDLSSEDRQTFLASVVSEIDRMMGLITELLDVSRIDTKRFEIFPQPVEWLGFLRHQATAFRVQHPNREIRFSGPLDETIVIVDPNRMRQVIGNLLSNALKYSQEGTPIDIIVRENDGRVTTAIVDHGIGIPPDELPHLFERFHRARNVSSRYYGGLGLGLYITRAIVEAHDGTISVTSDEGVGSTFTMDFPKRPPNAVTD